MVAMSFHVLFGCVAIEESICVLRSVHMSLRVDKVLYRYRPSVACCVTATERCCLEGCAAVAKSFSVLRPFASSRIR